MESLFRDECLLLIFFYTDRNMKNDLKKCRTPNGRFGVMAAVTPQTILCGSERLYPAGSLVGAATTPSRWDVVRQRRERCRQSSTN